MVFWVYLIVLSALLHRSLFTPTNNNIIGLAKYFLWFLALRFALLYHKNYVFFKPYNLRTTKCDALINLKIHQHRELEFKLYLPRCQRVGPHFSICFYVNLEIVKKMDLNSILALYFQIPLSSYNTIQYN